MNEKQVIKLTNSDVSKADIRKINNAGENFLTVSGVFKLIFKSNKQDAEKFQDWSTHLVGAFYMERREKNDTYFKSIFA